MVRRGGQALLAVLCAALVAGTWVGHRPPASPLVPGEATYLMQAASLWHDLDLTYTRADFDRLLLDRSGDPTDLELVSAGNGRRITYDRPFPYALYLAPFQAFLGTKGPAVANGFLLLLVAWFGARVLERRVGEYAPLWTALLLFASVVFVYVFLATGDFFLFALTTLAFLLLTSGGGKESSAPQSQTQSQTQSRAWRPMLAGMLLAVPVATEPLYLLLVFAAWRQPTVVGASRGLWVGFGSGWLAQIFVRWWAGGGLGPMGAERFRFTPETGFPLVDFTALEWSPVVHRLSALHWDGAPRFSWGVDLWLWLWDALYFVMGRNLGLLPYFAPLLLLLLAGSLRGGRRSLVLAAGLWAVALVVLHPFNFWGGPGTVANRLFLPVYGALWLFLDRPQEGTNRLRRLGAWAAIATMLVAALFLGRLWSNPWSAGLPERGDWYVTPLAERLLPYETSQRWLPGGAMEDHGGLAVKFLDENGWAESRRQRLMVEGAEGTSLLIGSTDPLDTIRLDFGKEAPSKIEVRGGTLGDRLLRGDGGISFRIRPSGLPRKHPTWWTPNDQRLYVLSFHLPGAAEEPLPFKLVGERFEEEDEP